MQIVADGVPQRVWDAPTERIIERRRTSERRKPRGGIELAAPVGAPVEPWPPAPPTRAWNRVLAISLGTFVCGALLATGVDRLRHHPAAATVIAQAEPIQSSAPGLAAPPPAQPSVTPLAQASAPAVEPLPKIEAAPAPAVVLPPAIDSRREKRPAVAKVTPAARGDLELAARPRRAPAAKPARATTPDPFDAAPAKKPAAPRQWVDPFAE